MLQAVSYKLCFINFNYRGITYINGHYDRLWHIGPNLRTSFNTSNFWIGLGQQKLTHVQLWPLRSLVARTKSIVYADFSATKSSPELWRDRTIVVAAQCRHIVWDKMCWRWLVCQDLYTDNELGNCIFWNAYKDTPQRGCQNWCIIHVDGVWF